MTFVPRKTSPWTSRCRSARWRRHRLPTPDVLFIFVVLAVETNLSKNCTCGISPVFCTVWTVGKRHCDTTGMSSTASKNWIWGTSTSSNTMDCRILSLMMITGTSTTRRSTRRPRPSPQLQFKSSAPHPPPSGYDGGYSQLHRTQAPPQTDVMIDFASSLCTGWSPRGRGSLSRGRRHPTATSSGQQLPKECRPSSDPARCPCRLLAGS